MTSYYCMSQNLILSIQSNRFDSGGKIMINTHMLQIVKKTNSTYITPLWHRHIRIKLSLGKCMKHSPCEWQIFVKLRIKRLFPTEPVKNFLKVNVCIWKSSYILPQNYYILFRVFYHTPRDLWSATLPLTALGVISERVYSLCVYFSKVIISSWGEWFTMEINRVGSFTQIHDPQQVEVTWHIFGFIPMINRKTSTV